MKRAFTLIELVVVLAIIAILTHFALRDLSSLRDRKLVEKSNRILQDISNAVWHEDLVDGVAGFCVDMGRFPQTQVRTNSVDNTKQSFTLAELWQAPKSSDRFAIRPAVESNLVGISTLKAILKDDRVLIPCGWRGPYLRLPPGADYLLDAWGNPFETPDDAGYARLLNINGKAVSKANELIGGVQHFGADARPDAVMLPDNEQARDSQVMWFDNITTTNTLAYEVTFYQSSSPHIVANARCRWYMPYGGSITGNLAKASTTSGSFYRFLCGSVPVGVCALVVDTGADSDILSIERVVVKPGGRIISKSVLVP